MLYLLSLCIGLLLVVCLLITLSQRLRIAYPILLVLGGLVISFIPGLPHGTVNPELIFTIFLPPLLCEAAWFTSWKDFWRWRRIIGFLAIGLVFLTASGVAYASLALIPGFTLALGFLLGGIVSPPDAVAATSILRNLSLPRRLTAILEGESLINDASSLIVFQFALAAVQSGIFIWYEALASFLFVTGLGIGAGLLVALGFYMVYKWQVITPGTHTVLTLITPYVMYVLAEVIHGSGVIAVVSGTLWLSYQSNRVFISHNRQQARSTWNTVGFVLNGTVFLLIGLQLPLISKALDEYSLYQAVRYGLLISLVVIGIRLVVTLLVSPFTHFISRFITVADKRLYWRGPFVLGYAGMRGVVSLAAALSIPVISRSGQPFPQRNLLLIITFIVILVTLVGQGLTLPLVIRWLGIKDPDHLRPKPEQRAIVHRHLAMAALGRLSDVYSLQIQRNALVSQLQQEVERTTKLATHPGETDTSNQVHDKAEVHRIRLDLLQIQRQKLTQLRHLKDYDEEVIRYWEEQLDLEEQRL
ncbi:Na+/H+ antiporter [Spirosoma endbachense]|uniref:Na+/H+ antiporter n=1 Tax=Spirosoma endbachense TaxID=2666025 RepID=A0A6P1W3B7_9BACT|nr:Na+/H+ antiporter [Spirosoma endbachense]QHV99384.1 Na+/H+ antiporter [Spirosoma endbachense]